MPSILMPSSGCINTKGLTAVQPPPPPHWDQGVYAKIEHNQMTSDKFFPTVWNDPTKPNSVVNQLATRTWMKGILLECPWGEINTGDGTYNWTFLDKVFSEIKTHAPSKKIMLLLPLKAFGNTPADVAEILPEDLRTTDGTYGDGKTRYNYLWNYLGANVSGYHMNLFQFQDGLTGNDSATPGLPVYTLRDRMYAFLQAIADRYANNPQYKDTFAGFMTSESASLTQNGSFITLPDGATNSVNNHFKGRIALLRKLKEIFVNHMVMEDCNFNHAWTDVMTETGLSNAIGDCDTDGLIAQKIAFTQSNYHTGTNLYGWTNINLLQGVIPIVAQAQGLDEDSKSGEFSTYYDYPDNPIAGWPDSSVTNNEVVSPSTIPDKQKPPTMQWIIDRANHFEATHLIVQHNYSNANNKYGQSRYNWEEFAADMDASVYANDPLGGMIESIPTYIV